MSFLKGKKLLITGIISKRSIAYAVAKACHEFGAELAFTYADERFKERVSEVANEFDSKALFKCDVSIDSDIMQLFTDLSIHWESFDGFLHAIAYAPKEALSGKLLEGFTKENFTTAHIVSSYSLFAMAKAAMGFLNPNSSIVTLSYLGAERVVPNYNIMGLAKASLESGVKYLAEELGHYVRVNSISSGPIKTLAASGIKDFSNILSHVENNSPIKRNITAEEVGNVAAFLFSNLSSAINSENIFVDGGFHNVVAF